MRRLKLIIRILIIIAACAACLFLVRGWNDQTHANLFCSGMFEPRREHNGYLQLTVLNPHPTKEYFEGELFLYYPSYQSPSSVVHMVQAASGSYGKTIIESKLVPFSEGLATPSALKMSIPTPGSSLRRFPFDSRYFDLRLAIKPPIRPTAVIVRNLSRDFIPECESFTSQWNENELHIRVLFKRNPFVQVTVVLMGLAALVFAGLLGLVKETEDLAVATASYFFSMWSIRNIVVPGDLGYSSLFDLWLMATSLLVVFIVAWRLSTKVA